MIKESINDFKEGIRAIPTCSHIAWNEIKVRYRGSTLGPFWISLSTIIQLVILGILYPRVFGVSNEQYIPWLIVSIVVWQVISVYIADACSTLQTGRNIYLNQRVPYSFFFFKQMISSLIVFAHQFPLILVASIFFDINIHPLNLLQFLFGLFITLYFCFTLGVVISIISAKYKDVSQIIANFLNILFLITPIIWIPDLMKNVGNIIYFNPFYYFLEFMRAPLLNRIISQEMWFVGFYILFIQSLLSLYALAFARKRIALWN